uniref:uncharacterized protein LOC114603752 n=1 Tax=Podarcis muralis TaxID=64176 RepID=UPI00109F191E|nr:uncharacterized protein LOC114603752 [Podarcis muralis]
MKKVAVAAPHRWCLHILCATNKVIAKQQQQQAGLEVGLVTRERLDLPGPQNGAGQEGESERETGSHRACVSSFPEGRERLRGGRARGGGCFAAGYNGYSPGEAALGTRAQAHRHNKRARTPGAAASAGVGRRRRRRRRRAQAGAEERSQARIALPSPLGLWKPRLTCRETLRPGLRPLSPNKQAGRGLRGERWGARAGQNSYPGRRCCRRRSPDPSAPPLRAPLQVPVSAIVGEERGLPIPCPALQDRGVAVLFFNSTRLITCMCH